MEIKSLLDGIGLTDSERKVYFALLELGDSSRANIVHKSGIAGSKIYEVLEKLREKGLASIYIQNKVKHFKPANPHQIINYLEHKKEEVTELETKAKTMLPALLSLYNSSDKEQEVELMIGLKGLEIIFREQIEILKPGETCYVIGGTKGSNEGPVQAFFEKVHLLREAKKIKTKLLFNKKQKESTERLYSSRKYPGTLTRYIEHSSPVAINMYHDRTIIIIFGKEVTSMVIKSSEVALSFMEYFNLLWKTGKA